MICKSLHSVLGFFFIYLLHSSTCFFGFEVVNLDIQSGINNSDYTMHLQTRLNVLGVQ